MSESPRVFATRALSAAVPAALHALEDLARHCEVEAWTARAKPSPEQLAVRAGAAEGLLCLLTDRVSDFAKRIEGPMGEPETVLQVQNTDR